MSVRSRVRAGGNPVPQDEEYQQGLVTQDRRYNNVLVNHLASGDVTTQKLFPSLSATGYKFVHGEFAFIRAQDVYRLAKKKTGGSGKGMASAPEAEAVPCLTKLNGWRFDASVDLVKLKGEEIRSAVMNQLTVVGLATQDLTHQNGVLGTLAHMQIGGITHVPAYYDMPDNAVVEYTVPTPEEVAAGKFSFSGYEDEAVRIITRPVRPESLATEFVCNVRWYLRDPVQFEAAMDPRVPGTAGWVAACQALFDHTTQGFVCGLDWMQRVGAYPTWPMVRGTDGRLREIEDGDAYTRSTNAAAHMFYAAVGYRDGVSAASVGDTVDGRQRALRKRLRETPSSYAEAIALAMQHVKSFGVTTTVGATGAPVAVLDPVTFDWYSGGARQRSSASAAAQRNGGAATFSVQQSFLKSVFWDGDTARFMFGTQANGRNAAVDAISGRIHKAKPSGAIINKQTDSLHRVAAAFNTVKALQDKRVAGRVSRASKREGHYSLYQSTVVT